MRIRNFIAIFSVYYIFVFSVSANALISSPDSSGDSTIDSLTEIIHYSIRQSSPQTLQMYARFCFASGPHDTQRLKESTALPEYVLNDTYSVYCL